MKNLKLHIGIAMMLNKNACNVTNLGWQAKSRSG